MMNREEKELYLEEQCDLIKGCIVTELKTEIHGEVVFLTNIKLKHPNGNEFDVHPEQHLQVVQTLWG